MKMWIVVLSVCSVFTMVVVLALCSCWKREHQKNDLLGLDGMVTQKNPDENVNHLPSATLPDVTFAAGDDTDSSKRPVTVSNPRRSLPDIPSEQNKIESNNVTWSEPTGDNSSELYATVEQYQQATVKRHTLANGIESRPSISQHSSISQADDAFSPYARLNYDKVHKMEHPYARVQTSNHVEQDENSSDEAALLRPDRPTTSHTIVEPVAPPRSRRTSDNSSISIDIPAASAVAGGIAANQELPYMTPPITQPNFSGDSQDSSKGYTSISVREPLASLRIQTKEVNKLARDVDPHYSTVSDDSDEMYTTIQDPNNQLYMSGSETYAQIQPVPLTVTAEVNLIPACSTARVEQNEAETELYEAAPQPPSVDSLKHVTHSRQASSSSFVGVLGSPKPEKRQANSPLPPPPSVSPDGHERPPKNLDEMYAKVHKNRKKSEKDDSELNRSSDRASIRSNRKSNSSASPQLEKKISEEEPPLASPPQQDANKYVRKEHNYETVKEQFQESSYAKLQAKDEEGSEPGYASINGPDSLLSTDPGYEVLKQRSEACSEIDPNYEPLRHRMDSAGYSTIKDAVADLYSVVNKQRKACDSSEGKRYCGDLKDFTTDEPNYESMPSEPEHSYAALKSTDSESDPNYESVNHNDPNYESVKYLDVGLNEPPYERLNDEDSSKTDESSSKKLEHKDSNPGYETIDIDSSIGSCSSKEYRKNEPPYERLHNDESSKTDSESSGYERIHKQEDTQIPGYETIKPKDSECAGDKNKSTLLYDSVSKEKSGTSTSEELQNSDEEIFEV